jgi:hypothetical protein
MVCIITNTKVEKETRFKSEICTTRIKISKYYQNEKGRCCGNLIHMFLDSKLLKMSLKRHTKH